MKNLKKDKHIYFGPYTDTYYLREVLKSIYKIFPQTNQTLKHLKIEKEVSKKDYNNFLENGGCVISISDLLKTKKISNYNK